MAVKVVIKRRIKEGKSRNVFSLLNKLRTDAMEQPGYIYGETLINHDDPHEVVVIAMWQALENWLNWKENELRQTNERQMEEWLQGPTEINTYVLGTYPHIS
jgi:heme-degrading monooxygenase HmoA